MTGDKTHAKQSGGVHIRKTSMESLYNHHILAAEKLESIDSNNVINVRSRDWDQVPYVWSGMALKYGK